MRILISWLFAGCLVVLCVACGAQGTSARSAVLRVHARDDLGRALAQLPIEVDGVRVATTDGQGAAQATVQAASSTRAKVRVICPEAYRPSEPRHVPLLSSVAAPLELELVCQPKLRKLAIVVRAPMGQGLTLRADGEPVGRVGPDGTLHALLERAPDASLRLSLDTSEAPKLRPEHPVRELRVADRDEIVVFDQAFTLAESRPPPRRRAAPKAPVPERQLPYAIGRAR